MGEACQHHARQLQPAVEFCRLQPLPISPPRTLCSAITRTVACLSAKKIRKTTSRLSQKYSEILKNITHPLVTRAQFAKLLLLDWGAQGWAFAQGHRQPHHAIERRPKLLGNLAGCSNGQTEFRAWHHMEPLPRGNHGK